MTNFSLTIPGQPVPQGRPRFRRGQTRPYDPAKSREYKQRVALLAKMAMLKQEEEPFEEDIPLYVTIVFFLHRGKSVKREYPTVKPDLDNLVKAIKDALSGVVYHDDKQIVALKAEKRYTEREDGVDVGIWPFPS